jgi:hypothetical protein
MRRPAQNHTGQQRVRAAAAAVDVVRASMGSTAGAAPDGANAQLRLIRCHAERKQPRFRGERCNGFVHRGTRELRVHSLVQHSNDAPRHLEVVGCIRCGALHVLEPGAEPLAGTRVLQPP